MHGNRRESSLCAKTRLPSGLYQLPTFPMRLDVILRTTSDRNMMPGQLFFHSLCLIVVFATAAVASAEENLPTPRSIILTAGQEAALAQNFVDRTLPSGRPQGLKGVLEASTNFRAAIPDLSVEIEELLVVNDRAVVRYTFKGHFTGNFKGVKGDGRPISFRAVDIYRVQNGQISDNWHLEDNLSLMQQLGVVKP